MRHQSSVLDDSVFARSRDTYWISGHPRLVHAPGALVRKTEGGKLVIRSELDDVEAEVDAPGHLVHPSTYDYLPDLMNLGEFSEACLLHTVRSRFTDASKIYTQIGSAILISVNPFIERKELYSAKAALMFQQESKKRRFVTAKRKEIDPHLFKMAEEAFQAMKANTTSQEIIISGISGSGKTEAAKLMLAYLANASNHFKYLDTGGGDGDGQQDNVTELLYDDLMTDSEGGGSVGDDEEDMFARFDQRVASNRSAVAIDLRQSVDVL